MATPFIPPTLGSKVSTRTISWYSMVLDVWGENWAKPDIAYEMTNGRKFDYTDRTRTGIYNGGIRVIDRLLLDPVPQGAYADMAPSALLQEGDGAIGLG